MKKNKLLKRAQGALEILVIFGILVIGAIVVGMFYIQSQKKGMLQGEQITDSYSNNFGDLDSVNPPITGGNPPVIVCGNNVCETGETFDDCPQDCDCVGPNCGDIQDPCAGINTEADCNADTCGCLTCNSFCSTCQNIDNLAFSPQGGTYPSSIQVSLTPVPDSKCNYYQTHYTLDNTVPTELSPVYSLPITITQDTNITAKVFAKNLLGQDVSGESKKEEYIISNDNLCLFSWDIGNIDNPKVISTAKQLYDIPNCIDCNYVLGNDIDLNHTILSNETWYNDINGWLPIGNAQCEFRGSFDGQGYVIKNLYINRPNDGYATGLFSWLGLGAEVKNVGVEDASVIGRAAVGILTGSNASGTAISSSYSTGNVSGTNDVGGLVGHLQGWSYDGNISSSYSTANVSGYQSIGGLVGNNQYGTISNCHSTGKVSGTATYIGGLIGTQQGGSTTESYSTGDVSGRYYVGGFVGWFTNSGTIQNSYSLGNISPSAYSDLGGFVGYNSQSTITNCYSIGKVAIYRTDRGFAGYVTTGGDYTDVDNFYDINTSEQTATPGNALGKTTAQMKTQSTFVDWNFTNIWAINPSINNGYPYLRSNPPN